jgi:hypothetical protein
MTVYRVFWRDGLVSLIPAKDDDAIVRACQELAEASIGDVVDFIQEAATDRDVSIV